VGVTAHRFILAEINTHRVLSRSYRSSRAVPVKTLLEEVRTRPAMPVHWGANRPGMQAHEELTGSGRALVEADMQAWLWMLGEDEASDRLMDDYNDYGRPQLRAICEKYGWLWEGFNHGSGGVSTVDLPWRDEPKEAAREEAPVDVAVSAEDPPPASPLAPVREGQGDVVPRKAHYGDGEQPWDVILASGWGPAFAASNVLKYLRRTKNPEHSLESARWYYARLIDGVCGILPGPSAREEWLTAIDRLEMILTRDERLTVRAKS